MHNMNTNSLIGEQCITYPQDQNAHDVKLLFRFLGVNKK